MNIFPEIIPVARLTATSFLPDLNQASWPIQYSSSQCASEDFPLSYARVHCLMLNLGWLYYDTAIICFIIYAPGRKTCHFDYMSTAPNLPMLSYWSLGCISWFCIQPSGESLLYNPQLFKTDWVNGTMNRNVSTPMTLAFTLGLTAQRQNIGQDLPESSPRLVTSPMVGKLTFTPHPSR